MMKRAGRGGSCGKQQGNKASTQSGGEVAMARPVQRFEMQLEHYGKRHV